MKANVSESDHPLLCEGTRRQRGDLATTLLVTYKDDQPKLRKVDDYDYEQIYCTNVRAVIDCRKYRLSEYLWNDTTCRFTRGSFDT